MSENKINNLISKLRKLEGAVSSDYDPMLHVLRTPSPSVNWALAVKGHGIPFGYSIILFGPPKGGKSLICNALIGQLHKDYKDAVAIYFNTELRGALQTNISSENVFGIDTNRLVVYDVNQPELIFDRIEKDIAALCEEGLNIKAIVIDSLKGIAGRRFLSASSVNQQLIGDQAATIQDGLMRILPVIRKYKIALIMTTHVRAEMDPVEQMRGNTMKMATAYAAKHMAEFFCYVEPNRSKSGIETVLGEKMQDNEIKDFLDKYQKKGQKIRFKVVGNSLGIDGRTAEFTLDYKTGIINQHEEIFLLAKNTGILEKVNNLIYKFKNNEWRGAANVIMALRDDPALQQEMLDEVYRLDLKGLI